MKKLFPYIVVLFFAVNAGAARAATAFDELREASAAGAVKAEVPESTETPVSAADPISAELYAADNWKLFDWGAKTFEFEGSTYAIKLSFVRGQYDPFAKTFKAEARYTLADVTKVYDTVTYWHARVMKGDIETFGIGGNKELWIFLSNGTVIVKCYDKTAGKSSEVVSFPYKELRDLWAQNAWADMYWINGKNYFFVPQQTWDGAVVRGGFVISQGEPFYYTSAMPIDYVELYRVQDGLTTYTPIGYSVPTMKAFDFLGQDTWMARDMTTEEWDEQVQVMVNDDRAAHGPLLPFTTRRQPAGKK